MQCGLALPRDCFGRPGAAGDSSSSRRSCRHVQGVTAERCWLRRAGAEARARRCGRREPGGQPGAARGRPPRGARAGRPHQAAQEEQAGGGGRGCSGVRKCGTACHVAKLLYSMMLAHVPVPSDCRGLMVSLLLACVLVWNPENLERRRCAAPLNCFETAMECMHVVLLICMHS